jgi:hypothetical protein
MRTPVAFDTDHSSKADSPAFMEDGDAENAELTAGAGAGSATAIIALWETSPPGPFAESVKLMVWVGARIRLPFNPTLPISGVI